MMLPEGSEAQRVSGDSQRPTVIRTSEPPQLSFGQNGPHYVFLTLWNDRRLIHRLVKREIVGRYRGSIFGLAWSFLTPVLMLSVYTFVFSVVFQARWAVGVGNRGEFALVLFAGLLVFQLFSECISRAPGLMLENVPYIKRIVFPLEILPWVVLGSALFNTIVSGVVLVLAYSLLVGVPHLTVLWLPVILLPLALMTIGAMWFLSSVGVFIMDARQIVGVIVPVMLFASLIFYPVTALPEKLQGLMYLNPLAYIIEQTRNAMLRGLSPDFSGLFVYLVVAVVIAWLGLSWFTITKRGFADVV